MAERPARRRPAERLDAEVRPEQVDLRVEVDPARGDAYRGEVAIRLRVATAKRALRLRSSNGKTSMKWRTLGPHLMPLW